MPKKELIDTLLSKEEAKKQIIFAEPVPLMPVDSDGLKAIRYFLTEVDSLVENGNSIFRGGYAVGDLLVANRILVFQDILQEASLSLEHLKDIIKKYEVTKK